MVFLVMGAIVLIGLIVVADIAARAWAEQRVAEEIETRLPESVTGDVSVDIGGFSVFAQYLTGRFDDVRLRSNDLTIESVPVRADVSLGGVPTDTSQTVDTADGELVLTQGAVSSLLAQQGLEGDVSFTGNRVAYDTTATFLGQSFAISLEATPSVSAGALIFTPDEASVGVGGLNVQLDELFPALGTEGLQVCIAQYLPEVVQLESVTIAGERAIIGISARELPLEESALARTGSCS